VATRTRSIEAGTRVLERVVAVIAASPIRSSPLDRETHRYVFDSACTRHTSSTPQPPPSPQQPTTCTPVLRASAAEEDSKCRWGLIPGSGVRTAGLLDHEGGGVRRRATELQELFPRVFSPLVLVLRRIAGRELDDETTYRLMTEHVRIF
jgi:hypothetical protein